MTSFDPPLEILLIILDHVDVDDLHPWTLVGKEFYARTNHLLWRQPPLRSLQALRQFSTILKASPRLAPLVRIIDMGSFVPSTPDVLQLVNLVPLLEELHIQQCDGPGKIDMLPRLCPHLTFLSFENKHLSDSFVQALSGRCKSLCQLHLLHCPGVSCQVFSMLAALPLLEELSIDVGWHHPVGIAPAREMALDLAQLHRLTQLTILRPPIRLLQCIATTRTDRDGNPAWPHLAHLYLDRCNYMYDTPMIGFIESHRLLESIVLVQGHFTDATLDAIANCLSDVVTHVALLNNRHITPAGIRRLAKACPLLECVNLAGCYILRRHFPEAGVQCLEETSLVKPYVNCLDWDAINKIQHGLILSDDNYDGDDGFYDDFDDVDMEEDDGFYDDSDDVDMEEDNDDEDEDEDDDDDDD